MKTAFGALLLGVSTLALTAPALAQQPNSPTETGVPSRQTAPPPANATVTPTPLTGPPAAGAPPAEVNQLSEVVVTANKREQNLNKVGITITALSARDLADRHITTLSDVAAAVPGLVYSPSTANTPIFTLRGVGFNEAALGVYPAVSVYLDQQPLPFPVLASHSDFDLERIEALKGPQGTLFGENSTGGAINYIAAKPTTQFHEGGDLTYGRFNDIAADAFVSGPITDNIQSRIAISGEHRDDWQYSYTRNDTLGQIDYVTGRWLTDWTPISTLKLEFDLNGWVDTSDPQALQYAVYQPAVSGVKPALTNYPFAPTNDPRAADWGPTEPRSDRKFGQAALRADYTISPHLQLTSLTSYDTFSQIQATDGDGYNLANYDLDPNNGGIHSVNQELRLASINTTRFNWVVGGNYEHSTTVENQTIEFPYSHVSSPATLNIYQLDIFQHQDIRNLAAFAHGELKLIDNLTLIGGVRYTDSRNSADLCNSDAGDGRINELFSYIQNLLSGASQPPLTPGSCYTLNAQTGIGGPRTDTTLHESNVPWQAGLNYQLTPDLFLYTTVSRGYKAGSFPVVAASTTAQYAPVTQESVTDYEGGFKATLLDHRLQLNAAGFHYDYDNKQVRGKINDPIFGLLDLLVNVPKSEINGGEASLTARPIPGLSVDGGVTYLSSDVERYTGYDVLGHVQDFSGDPLPFTPHFSYSINAEYRMEHAFRDGTPFFGATVVGRTSEDSVFDGANLTPVGDPLHPGSRVAVSQPYEIPGYATLDLRAGWESPDRRWRVMAYGKNVTDKYYIVNVIPGADTSARFTGQPATWGITIGFKM